ncbi:hypothetical protein [Alishewanella sp. HL-SH05]|uniref:hypothetical protein n=1 Tax=Alishewanella sp. HL-SH05 TaxID=3461145 RepID=UPI0040434085
MQIDTQITKLSRLPYTAGAELAQCSYTGLKALIIDGDEDDFDAIAERRQQTITLRCSLWEAKRLSDDDIQANPSLQAIVASLPQIKVSGVVQQILSDEQLLLRLTDSAEPLPVWLSDTQQLCVGQPLNCCGELHASVLAYR